MRSARSRVWTRLGYPPSPRNHVQRQGRPPTSAGSNRTFGTWTIIRGKEGDRTLAAGSWAGRLPMA